VGKSFKAGAEKIICGARFAEQPRHHGWRFAERATLEKADHDPMGLFLLGRRMRPE